MQEQVNITIQKKVAGEFPDVVDKVTAALADEGFGILTTIDVQATMKEKLERDMDPYVILGACNPALAWDALHSVPELGVLLPCNVVVRQSEEGVIVDAMEPQMAMELIDDATVAKVAKEARDRLQRAVAAV